MLVKMGWQVGQAVGAKSTGGLTEPIVVRICRISETILMYLQPEGTTGKRGLGYQ